MVERRAGAVNHDEAEEFSRVIVRVAVRTDAVVFHEFDRDGAVQYALFPRKRMPLEYAVLRRPVRRKRGTPTLP